MILRHAFSPLNNTRLMHLCGPMDEHLRTIETALQVRISHRQEHFRVEGPKAKADRALDVLQALYEIAGRTISKEKVQLMLASDTAIEQDEDGASVGLIAFGTTHHPVVEARDLLRERGVLVDYLRVRALPLARSSADFVRAHERGYVVEQNRDGQIYDLLRLDLPPDLVGRLRSVRHYDGQPIPAAAITRPLLELEEAVPV